MAPLNPTEQAAVAPFPLPWTPIGADLCVRVTSVKRALFDLLQSFQPSLFLRNMQMRSTLNSWRPPHQQHTLECLCTTFLALFLCLRKFARKHARVHLHTLARLSTQPMDARRSSASGGKVVFARLR